MAFVEYGLMTTYANIRCVGDIVYSAEAFQVPTKRPRRALPCRAPVIYRRLSSVASH